MTHREELLQILQDEIEIYRKLLVISREKGEMLLTKKMAEVQTLQGKEQHMVEEIAALERKRQYSVNALCNEHGIEVTNGSVTALVAAMGEAGEPLQERAAELKGIIEEMQGVNERNLSIIQQNIDVIEGALKNIKKKSESKKVYGPDGRRKSSAVLFDGKV